MHVMRCLVFYLGMLTVVVGLASTRPASAGAPRRGDTKILIDPGMTFSSPAQILRGEDATIVAEYESFTLASTPKTASEGSRLAQQQPEPG